MPQSTITFLMTTFNGLPYVVDAVDSVVQQTTPDWELVIVDDASTDGTKTWLRTINDSRIRVIELSENVGQTVALNVGISHVKTEFVARIDQDDLALPDRASHQLSLLTARKGIVLVAGWAHVIDENGQETGAFCPAGELADASRYLVEFDRPNPIAHSAATYSLSLAKLVGGYPTELRYANDYGLWCRLATHGDILVPSHFVCSLREHQRQTSGGLVPLTMLREVLEFNKKYALSINLGTGDRQRWRRSRRKVALRGLLAVLVVTVRSRRPRWRELWVFSRAIVR